MVTTLAIHQLYVTDITPYSFNIVPHYITYLGYMKDFLRWWINTISVQTRANKLRQLIRAESLKAMWGHYAHVYMYARRQASTIDRDTMEIIYHVLEVPNFSEGKQPSLQERARCKLIKNRYGKKWQPWMIREQGWQVHPEWIDHTLIDHDHPGTQESAKIERSIKWWLQSNGKKCNCSQSVIRSIFLTLPAPSWMIC